MLSSTRAACCIWASVGSAMPALPHMFLHKQMLAVRRALHKLPPSDLEAVSRIGRCDVLGVHVRIASLRTPLCECRSLRFQHYAATGAPTLVTENRTIQSRLAVHAEYRVGVDPCKQH